jgi:hypothetical protein
VRWQIAIAITRWKSVLDVDLWRARSESPLADVWWHGKLRYARLLDHRLRRLRGEPWRWLDRPRTTTWWRPWKLLQAEVIPRMTGSLSWQPADGAICRQVLAERPRRRPLPRRPQEVSMLLARSDTSLQPALAPAIAA